MLAQSEATNTAKKEENIFKQAWHSVEDALHLHSDPPVEDVPPPGNFFISTHEPLLSSALRDKRPL